MSFIKELAKELKQEAAVTRSFLELVDFTDANFKTHEKSENFGRLAIHTAEILGWWTNIISTNVMDFEGFDPEKIDTTESLLAYFDGLLKEALLAMSKACDEDLTSLWTMRNGEMIYFTLNKKEVLRKFCMNHFIHHRAQLGVCLRMLNKKLPTTYGPSADDFNIVLTEAYL